MGAECSALHVRLNDETLRHWSDLLGFSEHGVNSMAFCSRSSQIFESFSWYRISICSCRDFSVHELYRLNLRGFINRIAVSTNSNLHFIHLESDYASHFYVEEALCKAEYLDTKLFMQNMI